MDSFKRFDETMLPSKDAFYSKLNDEHSDDDYGHAKTVFKNLVKKQHLQSAVLLLANVFKNFRATCMNNYE